MQDKNMEGSHTSVDSNASSRAAQAENNRSASVPSTQRASAAKVTKPRRSVVHVACACCRKLRIKCDGNRPTCQPCAKRYEDCVYDVEANTTRSNALKRKNEELSKQNTQLNELYAFLRNRPLVEAEEIFRRIRSTQNPLDVLRHVATADVLMAQKVSPNSQSHSSHETPFGSTSTNGHHASRTSSAKFGPAHNNQ